MRKLKLQVLQLVLALVPVVLAKRCFDDARLCRSGELLFRETTRDCEFPLCAEVDAQVADVGCDATGSPCANGDIVYRDPVNHACPVLLQGNPCPTDTKRCVGGVVVHRNPQNRCLFDACPP